jgi:signal transduction histidine kinase
LIKHLLTTGWPFARRAPRTAVAQREREAAPAEGRLRQQAAIVHLSRRALRLPPSPSLLADVCRVAARVLQVDQAHVLELLPDGRTLVARAASGWEPAQLARWQMVVAPRSRVGEALRMGGLIVASRDVEGLGREEASDLLHAIHMHSGLAAVVGQAGFSRGLFGVYAASSRRFTRDEVQFVRALAQIVDTALERETGLLADNAARVDAAAAQAELLRVVVSRLRPALRESVSHLWNFRTRRTDSFTFRRAVWVTERQVATVADFIEDLSLLADLLEGGTLDRRIVQLGPILASLGDQLLTRASAGDVALQLQVVDDGLTTAGDANLVRRSLLNLLENAIRFTPPGGSVIVSAVPEPRWAVVEIADSGRGLTPAQIERLNRPASCSPDASADGPGVGWRLAAAIADVHGGTLAIASDGAGRGSTVTLRLPRVDAASGAQH